MLLAGDQYRAGIGLTTILPDFDFETFSEAGLDFDTSTGKWSALEGLSSQARGLNGCGARNYVQHPSFRILSLAWDLKDGKGRRWWRPDDPTAPIRPVHDINELLNYVAAGGLLEAFNSLFEWTVWNYHGVPCLGWPTLTLEQLRCCMAKSKASGYPPNLDDATKVLQCLVTKDPAGKALIRKLTMPRNWTKRDQSVRVTPASDPEAFDKFYSYNGTDIEAEGEASSKLPDLTPHELEVWLMDQRINSRGMRLNRKAITDLIAIVVQARIRDFARLKWLTNGAVEESTEVAATLRWMSTHGVHLDKLDEDTLEEAVKRTDYPPVVQEVLKIRQRHAFGSVNKLWKMKAQMTWENRVHDQYSYYGAHTSLWNGRIIQPANLYSGAFKKPAEATAALEVCAAQSLELVEFTYGPGSAWALSGRDPMDALEVVASLLRSMIEAAPGYRFISADFSAIQAVVLAAMFGEEWRLEVFRTHGKIYERTASDIGGVPFQEILDYRVKHKKHHPHRQDFGKLGELSGGFAAWIGGWKQFGADKVMTDEQIKRAILAWRAASPNIVEGWGGQTRGKFTDNERPELYGLEGAAIAAVLEPGKAFSFRGIVYQMFEDCLYCVPPSGGFIRYHSPRLERSSRAYASPWELEFTYMGWNTNAKKGPPNQWCRMKAYGGIFTQNVDSHMSREVQAHCMLALERNGYPIVMHTHDENVAEVLKGYGSVPHYMGVMRETVLALPWAYTPDGRPWPIKIPDAWECDFYGKWED